MAAAVARMRCACAAANLRTSAKISFSSVEDLLFGGEDFALVLLQLGRGEALGVDQRLLALVVGGGQMQVGLGDFDVVAEDVVEADLERLDAGAGALAGFDLGDELAAVLAEVAQFVELGVVAGADGAAVGEVDGRLVGDGTAGCGRAPRGLHRGGREDRAGGRHAGVSNGGFAGRGSFRATGRARGRRADWRCRW